MLRWRPNVKHTQLVYVLAWTHIG